MKLQKKQKLFQQKVLQRKLFQQKLLQQNVLQQNFTFYKPFLITIALLLLIAISIYLIKHRSKQNHLLPYHDITKLKETEITNILQKLKVIIN